MGGMKKTVDYYDTRIAQLKATIKRLIAEKRLVILFEREKLIKAGSRTSGNE